MATVAEPSAMQRSEEEIISGVRVAMARLRRPVDDLTDDEPRARAVALVGDRPDALEVILRSLWLRDDDP